MPQISAPSAPQTLSLPHQRRSILWRVVLSFLLSAVIMSIISAVVILVSTYRQHMIEHDNSLISIRAAYTDALASSLWSYDEQQLKTQVMGILNLTEVCLVRVSDHKNINIEARDCEPDQLHSLLLRYQGQEIGEFVIAFDHTSVVTKAIAAAVNNVLAQMLFVVLLSSLLGAVVYRIINRRISALAAQVAHRFQSNAFKPLEMESSQNQDEIDTLTHAFNELSRKMNNELQERIKAQQELTQINAQLEERVAERTRNLQHTVDELNNALQTLRETQDKLIEAEKLSSLGGMVAGIAHEINTPLGLCITSNSYIQDQYHKLLAQFERGDMTRQQFTDFLAVCGESLGLLDKNLQRAAHLIKSFKQVSEDQTGEQIRRFVLKDYLNEILETLSPKFKQTQHRIDIDCHESLWLKTYAGFLSQIITNLVMNSLMHGFEHLEAGVISIHAYEDGERLIIDYRDNGCGLSPESQQKIFEPFYTSKRGQGGTGLGMHLTYHLVQKLQGDIRIQAAQPGAAFRITLPKIVHEACMLKADSEAHPA